MIEINLLPQEYRVQEKTPLGLFLAVIVGICVNGAIFTYQLSLKNELTKQQQKNTLLKQEKERTDEEVAKVRKLEQEIAVAKRRQETIIEISQSKIVWSQKLIQFGRIMQDYPNFWIDRLNLARAGTAGQLTLNFYSTGNDLRTVAAFRERLQSDTNFWYHFDKFNSPRVTLTPAGAGLLSKYGYTGPLMTFDVQIPVK